MIISRKFVPSLFTILNAFCGLMSIINASNGLFDQACYFIVYATLFDAIDGLAARITKSSSEFGVELDSLSDVVSFGVAPSFLLYAMFFKDYNGVGMFVSAFVMAFSAIRLARFNISLVGFDKDKFTGLPTPATALTIISYLLYYHNKLFSKDFSIIAIFVLTIGLSLLMVSKFKYPTLPRFSGRSVKEHPFEYIVLISAVIVSIYSKGQAVFFIFLLYITAGVVMTTYNAIFNRKSTERTLTKQQKQRKK